MSHTVNIAARFNGPPTSGNGGYSCGLLASYIDGVATVRLHAPPPLETPMQVFQPDPDTAELRAGDTLIGTAKAVEWHLDIPPAPSLAEAERGQEACRAYQDHFFPNCFVCGPARASDDGLCLSPGPINDWSLLACTWQPPANLLDAHGRVPAEIIWSALDCPGFFAAAGADQPPSLLGELTGKLFAEVPGDETLIVYCWPVGAVDGRKRIGATAIANQRGEVLAASRSLWIELKQKTA